MVGIQRDDLDPIAIVDEQGDPPLLVYNARESNGGPLYDPDAIILLRADDIVKGKKGSKKSGGGTPSTLKPGVPIEPLVVRANAGDCIEFKLTNKLPDTASGRLPESPGYATLPPIVDDFNTNDVAAGNRIGIQPQLVAMQVLKNASNAGFNKKADGVPKPGKRKTYIWYAGDIRYDDAESKWKEMPIEFGAINLMPTDPIKHVSKGAIGALIIEPRGATWVEDADSRASATVSPGDPLDSDNAQFEPFREFVLMFQNFVNLRFGSDTTLPTAPEEDGTGPATATFYAGDTVPNLDEAEDPEDSGQKAFNYRTEPLWFRGGWAPDAPLGFTKDQDMAEILSNGDALTGIGDPQTPVFIAEAGMPVRLRVLHPGGNQRNNVFTLHGHAWQQEPYTYEGVDEARVGSTRLGDNPTSMQEGARMGVGPSNHFDALLVNGAGGKGAVTGDYLYRDMSSFQFDGGLWGIFRVTEPE